MISALRLMAFAIATFTGCMAILFLLHHALLLLSRWEVAVVISAAAAGLLTVGYWEDRNRPGDD